MLQSYTNQAVDFAMQNQLTGFYMIEIWPFKAQEFTLKNFFPGYFSRKSPNNTFPCMSVNILCLINRNKNVSMKDWTTFF